MARIEGIRINKRHADMAFDLPDDGRAYPLDGTSPGADAAKLFRGFNFSGTGSSVWVGQGADIRGVAVTMLGEGNRLVLGSKVRLRGQIIIDGSHLSVVIGAHTTFNNGAKLTCKGARHGIHIGRDCMFSSEIEIRTTDSHSLIDLDTMKRINHPDGVFIGDHVWVSKRATILKGADIGDDCVVGFGALVSGPLDATNAVIVGTPAKVVPGRRVTWSRKSNVKVADDSVFAWKTLPHF